MSISKQKDPKTRKTYLLMEGVVDAVYLNELKNPKTYTSPDGKSWSPTHNINVIVDGDKVWLGLTDKDTVRVKDADDNYHDLVKGVEVSLEVEENGEYNGVTQYSSKASKVVALDVSGAVQQQNMYSANKSQPFQKKDISGVQVGHSINGAINLIGGWDSPEELIETAKKVHDVSEKVKATYKESNPNLSDYDVGAASGNAVLNACRSVEDIEDVEAVALEILNTVAPEVFKHVKSASQEEEEASKKATKKVTKKSTKAKTSTKKNVTPAPVEDDEIPEEAFEDGDDGAPF